MRNGNNEKSSEWEKEELNPKEWSHLPSTQQFNVVRRVYHQERLNKDADYQMPHKTLGQRCKKIVKNCGIGECLINSLPIARWLPRYSVKQHLVGDMVAGGTTAVMHIPQGMAYALLAEVPPIMGLYMAFFPVLIYVIFGTSPHVSMGTFAVACLMAGKVVTQYATHSVDISTINGTDFGTLDPTGIIQYTPFQVLTIVTLTVGMFQILMWVLRLGAVSTLLSEPLVSGFTTAASFHVLASQLKDLFGVKIPKTSGNYKIIYTVIDVTKSVPNSNWAAFTISVITCFIIALNNEVLKPWVSKRSRVPVPIELLAIVIGTIVSKYVGLKEMFDISLVGNIPTGLPYPEVPPIELIPTIALDAFTITMVTYTISMSMALIFAAKEKYEIDANQELLALAIREKAIYALPLVFEQYLRDDNLMYGEVNAKQKRLALVEKYCEQLTSAGVNGLVLRTGYARALSGASNVFASFFSCAPLCASLSRSYIQYQAGAKTGITTVVSALLILLVLLWVGPFFELLPRSVLASIIVVSLKGMFMQVKELAKFWKLSKLDALVWLVTFIVTFVVNIDIGLGAGLLASLCALFVRSQQPYTCLLGRVLDTDLYLDIKRYRAAEELPGIKIFHYCGGLNFATKNLFRSTMFRKIGYLKPSEDVHDEDNNLTRSESFEWDPTLCNRVQCVVIDASALSYVDAPGVKMLTNIHKELQASHITVLLAGANGPVLEMIERYNSLESPQLQLDTFPTVHDAIVYYNVSESKKQVSVTVDT